MANSAGQAVRYGWIIIAKPPKERRRQARRAFELRTTEKRGSAKNEPPTVGDCSAHSRIARESHGLKISCTQFVEDVAPDLLLVDVTSEFLDFCPVLEVSVCRSTRGAEISAAGQSSFVSNPSRACKPRGGMLLLPANA